MSISIRTDEEELWDFANAVCEKMYGFDLTCSENDFFSKSTRKELYEFVVSEGKAGWIAKCLQEDRDDDEQGE